jgi:hypothetical protein
MRIADSLPRAVLGCKHAIWLTTALPLLLCPRAPSFRVSARSAMPGDCGEEFRNGWRSKRTWPLPRFGQACYRLIYARLVHAPNCSLI